MKIDQSTFIKLARRNKRASKFGACVDVYDEYDGYKLIALYYGKENATCAISPSGEIVSVTKSANFPSEKIGKLFQVAIRKGGKWLNGFDTVLPSIYKKYGFKTVARLAFNCEFAPKGWNYDLFRKYNDGKPDVVFMKLTSEKISEKSVDNYENGEKLAKS
jgi:hypothetical protein